jgi:release factor glutamine methyltransferase
MNNIQKSWKVIDILKTTTEYFTSKYIENPRLNAEQLLAHILKLDRVQLYIQFERMLSQQEVSEYRKLIRRRADEEPLQYITGKTEFMGLQFIVNPSVLIPRPETELLVEKIIETTNHLNLKNPSIIDIGTGSGCIAVSLAHYLKNSHISAIDISNDALEMAKKNARHNQINNIDFIQYDILHTTTFPINQVDFVVSNPPYISEQEMTDLPNEIKNYEPRIALTDDKSGLIFYQKILSLIGKGLKCKFVFMEMNANLEKEILEIVNGFGFKKSLVIPDLNKLPRILKIEI